MLSNKYSCIMYIWPSTSCSCRPIWYESQEKPSNSVIHLHHSSTSTHRPIFGGIQDPHDTPALDLFCIHLSSLTPLSPITSSRTRGPASVPAPTMQFVNSVLSSLSFTSPAKTEDKAPEQERLDLSGAPGRSFVY